jgi:hypothetical protein
MTLRIWCPLVIFFKMRVRRSELSHYDDVLDELRQKGQKLANQYIVELYTILRDEEKLPPEDCRAKIEHDCLDLWSKATIRKYLPSEAKDSKKQKAGKMGGESKKKDKKAMLLVAQNENGARINLAENDSISQKEQESRTFQNELNQRLSSRTLSPELLEANKIIADKDREIEELKIKLEEAVKQYPVRNSTPLFLPNNLAMEIYNAIRNSISSSGTILQFNLEHNGEEITAVYPVNRI